MNNSLLSEESVIAALHRKGYKATSQRIAICRFALNSREHPSAQNIYGKVKKMYPTVSLSTVYNTLGFLKELHLIQELPFAQADTRFDPYMEPHINLVCQRCGTINDIDDRVVQEMVVRVAATAKFTITGQRLDIYGICDRCSGKKPTSR